MLSGQFDNKAEARWPGLYLLLHEDRFLQSVVNVKTGQLIRIIVFQGFDALVRLYKDTSDILIAFTKVTEKIIHIDLWQDLKLMFM